MDTLPSFVALAEDTVPISSSPLDATIKAVRPLLGVDNETIQNGDLLIELQTKWTSQASLFDTDKQWKWFLEEKQIYGNVSRLVKSAFPDLHIKDDMEREMDVELMLWVVDQDSRQDAFDRKDDVDRQKEKKAEKNNAQKKLGRAFQNLKLEWENDFTLFKCQYASQMKWLKKWENRLSLPELIHKWLSLTRWSDDSTDYNQLSGRGQEKCNAGSSISDSTPQEPAPEATPGRVSKIMRKFREEWRTELELFHRKVEKRRNLRINYHRNLYIRRTYDSCSLLKTRNSTRANLKNLAYHIETWRDAARVVVRIKEARTDYLIREGNEDRYAPQHSPPSKEYWGDHTEFDYALRYYEKANPSTERDDLISGSHKDLIKTIWDIWDGYDSLTLVKQHVDDMDSWLWIVESEIDLRGGRGS